MSAVTLHGIGIRPSRMAISLIAIAAIVSLAVTFLAPHAVLRALFGFATCVALWRRWQWAHMLAFANLVVWVLMLVWVLPFLLIAWPWELWLPWLLWLVPTAMVAAAWILTITAGGRAERAGWGGRQEG